MSNNPPVRIRAVSPPDKARNKLFTQAFARIAEAMGQGFYLEAIAIIESLISDRLEARLTNLLGENYSFKTLEKIVIKSGTTETDEKLRNLIENDLNKWKNMRNRALHEMAKIEEGIDISWEERMKALEPTAKDGLALLRKIDNRCKTFERRAQKDDGGAAA